MHHAVLGRSTYPSAGREQREAAVAGAAATSLIPQTLEEMAADAEHAGHAARVAAAGQATLTREERRRRQRALDSIDAPSFLSVVAVSLQGISDHRLLHPGLSWCFALCLQLRLACCDIG